jgi:hypothetical protein
VGAIVAAIGVLEVAQVSWVLNSLTAFRPGFHVVGGQLRATSTLMYPTIASMYLEVVFCLGLWLLLDGGKTPRARNTIVVFAALSLIIAGIVATFTRAGLIAIAVALPVMGALHYAKARRFDVIHAKLFALGAMLAVFVLLSRSPEILLARLRTEGSHEWYGATYVVPRALEFRTGGEYRVPITLQNTGRVVWDSSSSPMFALSYHWLRADTEAVVGFEGWRTLFDVPVEPGTRVTMPANVKAPVQPGEYVLVWDVVHEHRAWLSTEGVTPGRSVVRVEGVPTGSELSSAGQLPTASRRPGRLLLWRAAVRIATAHPILGVGPDNFRKVYGGYIGQTTWDARVHANNMYLETLAGSGVVGLAAMLWLMIASGRALWRRWRAASVARAAAAAAMCAVWIAIAGHGLVDSFLSFTTTYVLFAVAAGVAFSSGLGHADRV